MIKNILNLGDASIYYDFGEQINKETNKKVISFFNSLKKANLEEICYKFKAELEPVRN